MNEYQSKTQKAVLIVSALLLAGCGGTSAPAVEEPTTTPERSNSYRIMEMVWEDTPPADQRLHCSMFDSDADLGWQLWDEIQREEGGELVLTRDEYMDFYGDKC